MRQTASPGKILLIDDGSTTPLSIDEKRFPGVRIIRQDCNRGLAAARNKALENCGTPLIASLDADVAPEPEWLERLIETANRENAAGVGGRLDEYFQENAGDRWRAVHMAQHWGDNPLPNPRFLYGANNLFRVDALLSAGGYNGALRTNYEDMSLSEKLYSQGAKLFYEPSARCWHYRKDTKETILRGFWQWHHAKGAINGEFDSPKGLIDRIKRVNFGIYRHRFDMDKQAGRLEFLELDLLLPWAFCALDLQKASQLGKAGEIPVFPAQRLLALLSPSLREFLLRIIPAPSNPKKNLPWHAEYLEIFEQALNSFNWTADRLLTENQP